MNERHPRPIMEGLHDACGGRGGAEEGTEWRGGRSQMRCRDRRDGASRAARSSKRRVFGKRVCHRPGCHPAPKCAANCPPGMLKTSWICRRCLTRLARPASRRLQSTGRCDGRSFRPSAHNTAAAAPNTVPPALLTRARSIALEHGQLTEKLANAFDTRAAKRVGECGPVVHALREWEKAHEVSPPLVW